MIKDDIVKTWPRLGAARRHIRCSRGARWFSCAQSIRRRQSAQPRRNAFAHYRKHEPATYIRAIDMSASHAGPYMTKKHY